MNRIHLPVAVGAVVLLASVGVVQAQDALTRDPAQVRAGAYTLDPEHSKITWSVNHMGFSTYAGQFAGATGTLRIDPKAPAQAQLDVTVKTDDVGSLNPALDKHLKSADFFDVANHPTATFRATKVVLTDKNEADIHGELTLRGVTRPIVIEAEFNQAGPNPMTKVYTLGFDGEAKIKRSDFGMTYAVPAVGDVVTLKIEAEFKAAS